MSNPQAKGRPRLPKPGDKGVDHTVKVGRCNPVFGSKLRAMRQSCGLSQAALSREILRMQGERIGALTIGRLERGTQTPLLSELRAIYQFFKVDPDWLIYDGARIEDYEEARIGNSGKSDLSNLTTQIQWLISTLGPEETIQRLMGMAKPSDLAAEPGQ